MRAKLFFAITCLAVVLASGCESKDSNAKQSGSGSEIKVAGDSTTTKSEDKFTRPGAKPGKRASAVFAGGCFWCMEPPYEKLAGVEDAISGYTGGKKETAEYGQVARGATAHYEAIKIVYNPDQISYADLLAVFWRNIDPTDAGGQFVDRGTQYRTAIFVANEEERKLAEASKQKLADSGRFKAKIVTPIIDLKEFYPAEDYHQDFYLKKTDHYKRYRRGSGRDQYIDRVWGADREYKPRQE